MAVRHTPPCGHPSPRGDVADAFVSLMAGHCFVQDCGGVGDEVGAGFLALLQQSSADDVAFFLAELFDEVACFGGVAGEAADHRDAADASAHFAAAREAASEGCGDGSGGLSVDGQDVVIGQHY